MKLESLAQPNLAGRNNELQKLQQCLELMMQGRGATVFISGEAGSGKTRLASEFLNIAKTQNTVVLTGWCLSNGTIPYFPFVEALDSYSSSSSGISNPSAQLTSIKTWLMGSTHEKATSTPQAWKDQTFTAVARELLELSTQTPLILFIDDLHWADSASLSLLHYLARSIPSERILILATYRSEEVDSLRGARNQLKEIQRLMARDDLFHEIQLKNLTQNSVQEIVESMLDGKAHTNLVEKLTKNSQGLPLFVVESIRMLFEQKELVRENNQWQLTVDEVSVPSKVKDIIYRRIDFLRPSQKRILNVAAVIGEKFDPQLVAAVVAKDSINVLESLNLMADNTLMIHCEGDHYWFNHSKYREMLYEAIPQLLRKEYHLRIAQTLENTKSPKELPVNDLAHHYAKGGNKEKSIKYALMAGSLALSRFSNNEALEYFNYALKNSSECPEFKDVKTAATEGLGEAFFANSKFEQALKTFEELGDSTEGAVKLRAYRRAMDSAFFEGEFLKLLTLTKKAEEYSAFDRLENARVLMNRARAVMFLGNSKAGLADFEAALDVFEKENSLPDIARVLLGLGGASHRQWLLEKGLANSLRAILYFKELGDLRGLADAYNRAGQSFGYRMLNQEALCMYQEAIRIGEKIGHYNRVAEAYASMSWVYEAMHQYPEALSSNLKALEYAKKTGSQWTHAIVYSNLTVIYSKLGQLECAEKFYNNLTQMPKEIVDNGFVRFNACKAFLAVANKQWIQANENFQESLALIENGANPSVEIMMRNGYANALEKQGQLNEAKKQRTQAQELLRRIKRAFEHSNIYAFFLTPKLVESGKEFQIRLDMVNVSVKPAEIIAIEGLIPKGLKIQSIPNFCSLGGDCIIVHPKTISPFEGNSIKVNLLAEKSGFFTFYPQVRYIDDTKKTAKFDLPPVIIGINAPLIDHKVITPDSPADITIEFHSEITHLAFQYLLRVYVQDFVRQKLPIEVSGWRSLMDIAKNAKITKHSLYGFSRSKGKPISELERLGLVESKYFLGERGRGGRVLKVRVYYDNQAVRAQIKHLTN